MRRAAQAPTEQHVAFRSIAGHARVGGLFNEIGVILGRPSNPADPARVERSQRAFGRLHRVGLKHENGRSALESGDDVA